MLVELGVVEQRYRAVQEVLDEGAGGRRDLEPAVMAAHQGLQRRDVSPHSARSVVATDVRAARQPGTRAVRMARASVDMATIATVTIEMAGWGTT